MAERPQHSDVRRLKEAVLELDRPVRTMHQGLLLQLSARKLDQLPIRLSTDACKITQFPEKVFNLLQSRLGVNS